MIALTEKLLMEAGGWQAMKEARAIHAAGRVREAAYEPPNLIGKVRGGETELRSGLKIISRSDVENLCPCIDSKRRGLICAHSLAVGLMVIKGAPVEEKVSVPPPKAPPSTLSPFSTTDGAPCTLHVILPPNFNAAWEKKSVMVVVEAALGTQRKPLATLDVKGRYQAEEADCRLADKLMILAGGKLPSMTMLSRDQFLELLAVLAGHPRVTFGKTQAVTVNGQGLPPELTVERAVDGSLKLAVKLEGGSVLQGGSSAWLLASGTFTPIAPGLPPAYLTVLERPVVIPAMATASFLEKELPTLAAFFQIEGEHGGPPEPAPLPTPKLHLSLEGSLNYLNGTLSAVYGDRTVTLDSTGAALARFARNLALEQSALERLRAYGFTGPDTKGQLVLKGEPRILAFFAAGLPRLEREWSVKVGERFQHVTRDVERIAPKIEIRSSGEQWFDLSYEMATPAGERFSGAEIQRLLQAGQSHVKRKNGKIAVFDPAMLDEFEQFLRDGEPKQVSPGLYRLDRRQAGPLDNLASETGLSVEGETRWRAWAQGARQLDKLTPIDLGTLQATLRPYQKQGVFWLHFLAQNGFGGILADEMGLGKTLQALAFLRTQAGKGPSLVVCPSTLIFNWRAEAERWAPELRILVIEGASRAGDFTRIKDVDLVITSYPLLRRDVEHYRFYDFAVVILDEAQHIKNPDSQNAQAATALKARHRFVLTGTPVENSVRDLWSLMHFLMPGFLGSRTDFRDRYENPISREPGGLEQGRLSRRIRPFLLRRTKDLVAKEIPKKLEQVAYCELTEVQSTIYKEIARTTRQQISALSGKTDAGKSRMLMLTALLRLRQAACDVRLLGLENPPSDEEASAKLDLLSELLNEAIDGGHRVLVFSQFVTMLGHIRTRLEGAKIDYCYLDGQSRDRVEQVQRFQAGETPVFLISLKAGGTGLNLTAADTVIHFDPWWNPAVEAQATDRAHRIGQKKVVTSYKLIARGTVEEKILNLQQKKKATIAATLDSEQPMMEGLTMAEIEGLLE